jgi:predicted outer membrane protein
MQGGAGNEESGPPGQRNGLEGLLLAGIASATAVGCAAVIASVWQGLGPWFPFRLLGATFLGPGALVGGVVVILWGLVLHLVACVLVASVYVWMVAPLAGWLRCSVVGTTLALAFYQLALVLVLPWVNPWLEQRLHLAGATALIFPLLFGLGLALGERLARGGQASPISPAPRWWLKGRAAVGPAGAVVVGLAAMTGRARAQPDLIVAHDAFTDLCALAATRAEAPQVRRLAALLAADHKRLRRETAALAERQGAALLTLPSAGPPDPVWQRPELRALLASRRGQSFDEAFVKTMMDGHQDLLAEVRALDRFPTERAGFGALMERSRVLERQHLAVAVAVFADVGISER